MYIRAHTEHIHARLVCSLDVYVLLFRKRTMVTASVSTVGEKRKKVEDNQCQLLG